MVRGDGAASGSRKVRAAAARARIRSGDGVHGRAALLASDGRVRSAHHAGGTLRSLPAIVAAARKSTLRRGVSRHGRSGRVWQRSIGRCARAEGRGKDRHDGERVAHGYAWMVCRICAGGEAASCGRGVCRKRQGWTYSRTDCKPCAGGLAGQERVATRVSVRSAYHGRAEGPTRYATGHRGVRPSCTRGRSILIFRRSAEGDGGSRAHLRRGESWTSQGGRLGFLRYQPLPEPALRRPFRATLGGCGGDRRAIALVRRKAGAHVLPSALRRSHGSSRGVVAVACGPVLEATE